MPFMDKLDEVTANGITIISAIGNDGPIWGTLFRWVVIDVARALQGPVDSHLRLPSPGQLTIGIITSSSVLLLI